MANMYFCKGCGGEFNEEVDNVFPQGKDKYCRGCSKKHHYLDDIRTFVYNIWDKVKWDCLEDFRKLVYKSGSIDVEKLTAMKEDLKAKTIKMRDGLGLKPSKEDIKVNKVVEVDDKADIKSRLSK